MTVKELFDALANESGGGVNLSETIGPQGIRGFVLFLDDGRVAAVNLEEEKPPAGGGTPHPSAPSALPPDPTPSVVSRHLPLTGGVGPKGEGLGEGAALL